LHQFTYPQIYLLDYNLVKERNFRYTSTGESKVKEIVEPLLNWYKENKRDLPWRKDTNPYHVWVSEIMLQQTRVEAVKEYYQRFMKVIPTVEDLAKIEEDDLLKLWEGLGYYTRARNLKKAAIQIMDQHQGIFPENYNELLSLPGIGEYTAGAIASIAFSERVSAIDGNVIRVMLRLKNSRREPDDPKLKKELFHELNEIMPEESGNFNQAMMDLGATVCIPNTYPNCSECPLKKICKAYQEHNTLNVPIPKKSKQKKKEKYTIIIFECNGKVALRKRPNEGLLANLYEFFTLPEKRTLPKLKLYLEENKIEYETIQRLGMAKHIFTHKIWDMQGYLVTLKKEIEGFVWVDKREITTKYSIPTAFSSYKKWIEKDIDEKI